MKVIVLIAVLLLANGCARRHGSIDFANGAYVRCTDWGLEVHGPVDIRPQLAEK